MLLNKTFPATFKEFHQHTRSAVDFAVIEEMAAWLNGMTFAEGMGVMERASWPWQIVEDTPGPVGFLMPKVPPAFAMQISLPSGRTSPALGHAFHLLNTPQFLASRGLAMTDRQRFEVLFELAQSLDFFHRWGVTVGDLSSKNVLVSTIPKARVYFIDCDSMRLNRRSAQRQFETPDWDVASVSGEELGTTRSDSYKLALMALRLLVGEQMTRNPSRLGQTVPSAIRNLIRGGLEIDPLRRPLPVDWLQPLRSAGNPRPRTKKAPSATTGVRKPVAPSGVPIPLPAGPQLGTVQPSTPKVAAMPPGGSPVTTSPVGPNVPVAPPHSSPTWTPSAAPAHQPTLIQASADWASETFDTLSKQIAGVAVIGLGILALLGGGASMLGTSGGFAPTRNPSLVVGGVLRATPIKTPQPTPAARTPVAPTPKRTTARTPSVQVTPTPRSRRSIEKQLLSQVSSSIRKDCQAYRDTGEFDPFEAGATAAISCDFGQGQVAELALFKFSGARSLTSYYSERIAAVGLQSFSQGGSYCSIYGRGDFLWAGGRVSCWVSSSGTGRAHVRWTNHETGVYGVIDGRSDDLTAIYEWWQKNMQ